MNYELPSVYQNLIHTSRYAKWLPAENRRETWIETVTRCVDYLFKDLPDHQHEKNEVFNGILNLEIMPSMRLMMTAGPACDRENVCAFNCSAIAIDSWIAVPECMYILCCGTGVGYSVESKYTDKIPAIPILKLREEAIVIKDSKLGWAEALKEWMRCIFEEGVVYKLDYSKIRKKGERLKTMGGYASGPEPLMELFQFLLNIFVKKQGQKLTPIDWHSVICKTASIVVCGGVRRSALISLSDLSDQEMAKAKSGDWWVDNKHYALANNSAIYQSTPPVDKFLEEITTIYKSYSGERGIVNQAGAWKKCGRLGRKKWDFLKNPCSEVELRGTAKDSEGNVIGGGQFCNLTEVIVRPSDTLEDIKRKLRLCTIIGTIQSSYTNFQFLRPGWKQNTDEEALLGVSLTGIFGNETLLEATPEQLEELRDYCEKVNKEWAPIIGVNPSVARTVIKPSGTCSALCGTSSGIHAHYSEYYIRRVRINKIDPVAQFLKAKGMDCEEDFYNKESLVFSFPMRAPENKMQSIQYTTETLTAKKHFEYWLKFNKHWSDHSVSVTINYTPEEFIELIPEVYKNFDYISGISLLPKSEHTYQQAPFEAITREEYNKIILDNKLKGIDKIDFSELRFFEKEHKEKEFIQLSCTAGGCEITEL